MTRHGFQILLRLPVLDVDLEESIIVPFAISVLQVDCGEFLIGRVIGRGDVVGQQIRVCHKMAKLHKVAILNFSPMLNIGWIVNIVGNNLPIIIGVVEWIPCYLLSLARYTSVIIS